MLVWAWLWLGLLEAVLVGGGFFFALLPAGWSPGFHTAGLGLPELARLALLRPDVWGSDELRPGWRGCKGSEQQPEPAGGRDQSRRPIEFCEVRADGP